MTVKATNLSDYTPRPKASGKWQLPTFRKEFPTSISKIQTVIEAYKSPPLNYFEPENGDTYQQRRCHPERFMSVIFC